MLAPHMQVFASPGIVLADVHTPHVAIIAWLFGGILSFFGLLSLVELVVETPSAGGAFTYIRMAFGDAIAFSWQWCDARASMSLPIQLRGPIK